MPNVLSGHEEFTANERLTLTPYFTNLDSPVFAITNLPEVVKGALFARYSRSAKSLRRLFLDEFSSDMAATAVTTSEVGVERAEKLYTRVFSDYGDDSVAQLGGAHIACEGASNILTKILERGRLMSYLEQSTRYVPYTDQSNGRWKYLIPEEIKDPVLWKHYTETLDAAFATYAHWLEPMQSHYRKRFPKATSDSDGVYRAAIRAKALDTLRGLLPAATQSNVGIYGSGQAYEALLLQMRANPLAEAQQYAAAMLTELRKVIPAFLTRVDRPDRGERWSKYLAENQTDMQRLSATVLEQVKPEPQDEVVLTDYDPDGEIKIVAGALYAVSRLPDDQLLSIARSMSTEERVSVLQAYVGNRTNRRHKPGRAFERATYRFDVLSDYGAFRDLQRHRLLTLEWQNLTPAHGYTEPAAIEEVGALNDWQKVMTTTADLHDTLITRGLERIASYAVSMAYRVRFYMQMNAREAMHLIELRSAPQGHPAYRRVSQKMHKLIGEQAGHQAVAAAMKFADHSEIDLERLKAERASEKRRQAT